MRQNYWQANDLNQLFKLCVGKTYGENPLDAIDQIREVKSHEANNIVNLMSLTAKDTVLDLGSGCGFIANHVAGRVNQLHCADINAEFLAYCQQETIGHANVTYHLIDYADLTAIPNVTAIYSTALFIHFNLYDIYYYLKSCWECLEPGGKLAFDYLDDQQLNINADVFQRHALRYHEDGNNLFTNLYYNNSQTLRQLYQQLGFEFVASKQDKGQCFLLLQKP
jgi:cyclopropane fatty-acyl-phospholipid synthase-like methyltransferase